MKKNREKTITQRIEIKQVNNVTGEILQESQSIKRKVGREPDFIKLYLDDVMMLSHIPKSKSDILYLLLRKMNYDNEITVVASHKRAIAQEVGCSVINIDKTLALLVEKGVLFRKERGIYIANPLLFGKGNWENIEELRLSIDYKRTANNKKIAASISYDDKKLTIGYSGFSGYSGIKLPDETKRRK